jgi:hypothetical protein
VGRFLVGDGDIFGWGREGEKHVFDDEKLAVLKQQALVQRQRTLIALRGLKKGVIDFITLGNDCCPFGAQDCFQALLVLDFH